MGYGLIHIKGKNMELMQMGVLHLSKLSSHELKLKQIFERTLAMIDEYKPDELAVEAPFFGKNVQSMLKLGRAQGVAMAAGLYRDIPIFEYSPKKIKKSITGNGNASKQDIMKFAVEKWGDVFEEQDFADAACIALWGIQNFKSQEVTSEKKE